jgi:hypothetical protein
MEHFGFGQRSAGLPSAWIAKQALLGNISRCLYPPAATLIRISVIAFVRRLSPHSWIYYTTIILLIVNFLFTILSILSIVFQCAPVSASFQAPLMRAVGTPCLNAQELALAVPLTSVGLDLCVWLLPVVLILRVQLLDWRRKAVAVGLLGMGLFACIAGAMRLPLINSSNYMEDPSYSSTWMALWTSVEIAIGIITASVPALAPVIMHCARKATGGRLPSFLPWGCPQSPSFVPDLEAQTAEQTERKIILCPVDAQIEVEMRKYQSTETLWKGSVDGVEHEWRREVVGDEESGHGDSIKRVGEEEAKV